MRVHLAVLCICDAHALYVMDWDTVVDWNYVTIYGILTFCVYCMRYVDTYNTHRVVVCIHVRPQEMMSDYVMGGLVLYDERCKPRGIIVFKLYQVNVESLSLNFVFNPSLSTPLVLCIIVFHL
jgi:hypothetical protein